MSAHVAIRRFIAGLETAELKTVITVARSEQISRSSKAKALVEVPLGLAAWLENYFDTIRRDKIKCLDLQPIAGLTYFLWPALKYYLQAELGAWITSTIEITNLDYDDEMRVSKIYAITELTNYRNKVKIVKFSLENYRTHLHKAWKVYMLQSVLTTKGKKVQVAWANRTVTKPIAGKAVAKDEKIKSKKDNAMQNLILAEL